MNPRRLPLVIASLVALTLAACVPVVPGLRYIDGQTWSARFDVQVQAGGSTLDLPVLLSMTFSQQLSDVSAEATIEYDAGIFRLQTGGLVHLSGNIGFDDGLRLESTTGALTFDGRFVGDTLIGTVAIAGVVPVGDVVFTRSR